MAKTNADRKRAIPANTSSRRAVRSPSGAAPASKAGVLDAVKGFTWRTLDVILRETPRWRAFRDERGRNLLHICCGVDPKLRHLAPSDGVKTAEVLLAAGLDIDAEAFSEGAWKATPLWFAIARGRNLALAKYLIGRGASPEHCLWAAAWHDDLAAIRLLVHTGAKVDAVAEDETPFLSAVKQSRFRSAELLLRHGANPSFQDSRGMTALHYMLKKGSDERHLRMVVSHGARGDLPNRDGVTAYEILAKKRSPTLRKPAERLG